MGEIDWRSIQQQVAGGDRQKQESLSLEASKVAATTIDHSYSTFNNRGPVPPGFDKESYGGVFLGCERIEIHDAVRVWLSPEEQSWHGPMPVVLAVEDILTTGPTNSDLSFYGDIWCLQQFSINEPAQPIPPLPRVMAEEMIFRNRVKAREGIRFAWIKVQEHVTKAEMAIRGRFYQTAQLMKLIKPAEFQTDLQRGVIEEVQTYLNNRRNSSGPYIGRKKNRAEAVRDALPQDGSLLLFGPNVREDY